MDHLIAEIDKMRSAEFFGRVSAVRGQSIEIAGASKWLGIGSQLELAPGSARLGVEVVGFRGDKVVALPYGSLTGVGVGLRATIIEGAPVIYPDRSWRGRILNGAGDVIDGGPPLIKGPRPYPLLASPPRAQDRQRLGPRIDLGIRALNTFVTCCRGQRMGIFAGSGVGKSVLLSMIARYTEASVNVIGLIGERGREVREFVEDDLGAEGLARSVVVVATSDEPALQRRRAAYLTMALSEYFRDEGDDVLCLMDSITRFAMAQREIGLSGGEPPTAKGYTPTVFAELPRLLERAGPGTGAGTITALFGVLVEGDDHNEPIADAVRGILDGHIVLSRRIAERGRYPAIDILRSVSRTMPDCNSEQEADWINRAREMQASYEDMEELVRVGAYRAGSDPLVDRALFYQPVLNKFLSQKKAERATIEEAMASLQDILSLPMPGGDSHEKA